MWISNPKKPSQATEQLTCEKPVITVILGKAIDAGKTALLKPEKKERKVRKALADLSKPAKPVLSATIKGSTIKENSLRGGETTKKAPKSSILTDEEIKKCHEWAKEGNEKVHYTGNDIQKNEKEVMEKRNCSLTFPVLFP